MRWSPGCTFVRHSGKYNDKTTGYIDAQLYTPGLEKQIQTSIQRLKPVEHYGRKTT